MRLKSNVKEDHRPGAFVRSFKYAGIGILTALKVSRNIKIHCLIALLVILAGFNFKISPVEFTVLILVIALVICMEMVNTAVERTIDLLTEKKHIYAKIAKDVAAGAVLMSVIAAIIIGIIIFLPHLIK